MLGQGQGLVGLRQPPQGSDAVSLGPPLVLFHPSPWSHRHPLVQPLPFPIGKRMCPVFQALPW